MTLAGSSTAVRAAAALVILPGLDGVGARLAEFSRLLAPAVEGRIIGYPRDRPLGYDGLEALVRAALPAQRRFFLLAESFAGPLAIRISADPPAGLAGLVLCGTFARNPFPWLRPARALAVRLPIKSFPRWLRAPMLWGSGDPRRAPPQAERSMASVDSAVIRRRLSEVFDLDDTHRLAGVALPALVLAGRRDLIVPRSATRRLTSVLRAAELVEIDGPHLLLQARPRECADAVLRFIERCS
jgi:pimeloyl-[acyl-carrier protein] methyl ester esterase